MQRRGFTLVELLLVLALMAVLAAMLLPAIARVRERARLNTCLDNLRQLGAASQLYAADNSGLLASNTRAALSSNQWVTGSMQTTVEATNAALLRQSKFFPYLDQVSVFHCPADLAEPPGAARVRSYAMNSWMGSRFMENFPRPTGFRTFMKETEFSPAGAAAVWYLTEEHPATLDDGWFLVTMDDSVPFASFPAARHQRSYTLEFADGHAAPVRLHDAASDPAGPAAVQPRNADWLQLKQMTTVP